MMATNNMAKGLYAAPQGLDQLGVEEEPIEITIEDPEAVSIEGRASRLILRRAKRTTLSSVRTWLKRWMR
jgi:SOS response regulatory protein OraA/RecX